MRRAEGDDGLTLRALYTLPQLARVAGVSRQRLQRVLDANGVTFVRAGRRLFVPLSEIAARLPSLWGSLQQLCVVHAHASERRSGRDPPR